MTKLAICFTIFWRNLRFFRDPFIKLALFLQSFDKIWIFPVIIWWNFRFFHNSLQNFCFFSFDKICVFAEILHSCFFRDSSDEFFCASFFPRFLPKVEIFAILLPKVTFIQGFFAESQVFPWFYTESRVFLYSMLKAAFFYDFLTKCILFLRSLGKSHVFPQFFCRKSSFCSRFFAESRVFCDTLPKIAGFFFSGFLVESYVFSLFYT